MKRLVLSPTMFVLFWVTFCSLASAQEVPPLVKKEIVTYLKKQQDCKSQYVQFDVRKVKIGPAKFGFIGDCRYGGGISVLYEKTPTGIRKLLEVEVGMNGGFDPSNKLSKGYYDMSHWESSGGSVMGEIYRWNGSRYVKYKSDF